MMRIAYSLSLVALLTSFTACTRHDSPAPAKAACGCSSCEETSGCEKKGCDKCGECKKKAEGGCGVK